jgi:hypothetical protein
MEFLINYYFGLLLLGSGLFILMGRLFYPNHRSIAFMLWVFGLVSLADKFLELRGGIEYSNVLVEYAILFGLLLVAAHLLYFLTLLVPFSSEIGNLSREELEVNIAKDSRRLAVLKKRLDRDVHFLWEKRVPKMNYKEMMKNHKWILHRWKKIVKSLLEVERIAEKYTTYFRVNPFSRMKQHRQCFIVYYAAHMQLYENSFHLTKHLSSNAWLVSMLNDEAKGVPKYSFDKYSYRLTGVGYLMRQLVAYMYYKLIHRSATQNHELFELIQEGLEKKMTLGLFLRFYLYNMLKWTELIVRKIWFPIQKNVAYVVGKIVLTTREYHIKPKDLAKPRKKLLPGDVLIERREWDASNFAIQGYWTHAALYMGSLKELDAYFKTHKVKELKGKRFSQYVKQHYPDAYAVWKKKDKHAFDFRVLESKAQGVILTSLEYSANADAVAVLRAKETSPKDRFRILKQGLGNFGKPYDFDFNFATHSEVMCSELVYRAYLNTHLIHFVLSDFGGRIYFFPNNLAKKYDEEFGDPHSELSLVFFLDGHEKTKKVKELDEIEFRKSWKRTMWQVLMEAVRPAEISWE